MPKKKERKTEKKEENEMKRKNLVELNKDTGELYL